MTFQKSIASMFLCVASLGAGAPQAFAQNAALPGADTGAQMVFANPSKEHPAAKQGFSQITLPSGKTVGYEFSMDGDRITNSRPYDLDNPAGVAAFHIAVNEAQRTDALSHRPPVKAVFRR